MDGATLSIGAFSRASSISVRTLRNYHASGLLVPAAIDRATGYRSYAVDQLADALAIVRLRALDVPLEAVHRIVQARDPAITAEILREHEATMRARLEETERIVADLQHGMPETSTPAHITTTSPVHVLELRRPVPSAELWPWIDRAASVLHEVAGPHRRADEPVSALYTPALDDDAVEDVTVFVIVDEPFLVVGAEGCRLGELPGGRWASLVHTGGFNSVGDTYRMLGAWVARHAIPRATPIWERYPHVLPAGVAGRAADSAGRAADSAGRAAASDAVVEIRWPVE